jgi:hypothetical protein
MRIAGRPLRLRSDCDEAEPADHDRKGQRCNQEVEAIAEHVPVNDRIYPTATTAERRSKRGM